MGLNRAQLVGYLGAPPDLKYTQSGQPVMRLRIATSDRWVDETGAKQERTEWHTVIVWGKRAEGLSKILSKGAKVYVEGQLRTRSWEKDGVKQFSTEINMTDIDLLAPPKSAGADAF